MDRKAALTGEMHRVNAPEEDGECESGGEVAMGQDVEGGEGRELPAGALPPPHVLPQTEPRRVRNLTTQEQRDLQARLSGKLETRQPPSYL